MREAFQKDLQGLIGQIADAVRVIEQALAEAGTALEQADAAAAQRAIALAAPLEGIHADLDDQAIALIARQQPVASDLRTLVVTLRMSMDLERMGILVQHLGKIAGSHAPRPAVAAPLRSTVRAMDATARRILAAIRHAIETTDLDAAVQLDLADDEMDRLHAQLTIGLHRVADGAAAADAALIGRYYERLADHAVSMARGMVYRAGRGPFDPESRHLTMGPGVG